MSLQHVLTTRRKFLERSALGAGSVFFLPGLLASCTDHIIPPDHPPINPPLLGDYQFDWNEAAKSVVSKGLSFAPEGGEILSGLVDIFWPSSGGDAWSQVRSQVEALINQKIQDQVYSDVKDALGVLTPTPTGLVSYIQTYQNELKNGGTNAILDAWNRAQAAFAGAQQHFQNDNDNNQVPLLPLFAQFANLYLPLLRDGVVFGKSWGRTDNEHNNIDVPALKNAIRAFFDYAANTYNAGRGAIVNSTPENWSKVEPFRSMNVYDRLMTMTVLDYMDSWQYYDVTQFPNGAKNANGTNINLYTREIYSDPYGNILKSATNLQTPFVLPSAATQFPTQITVWGGERIDAVQLTYPAGGGPGGVTTTPRMGDKTGGSTNAPHGGIVDIEPGFAITQALVTYDIFDVPINGGQWTLEDVIYINTLQFIKTSNNSVTEKLFGGAVGKHQSGVIQYPKYALSSIYIHGPAEGHPDTSVDCIVFGFMRVPGS